MFNIEKLRDFRGGGDFARTDVGKVLYRMWKAVRPDIGHDLIVHVGLINNAYVLAAEVEALHADCRADQRPCFFFVWEGIELPAGFFDGLNVVHLETLRPGQYWDGRPFCRAVLKEAAPDRWEAIARKIGVLEDYEK